MLIDSDTGMPEENETDVFDEAADWFFRLEQNDQDALLLADLALWLDKSPVHRHAWEKTCRSWNALGAIPPSVSPPLRPMPVASVNNRRSRGRWPRKAVSRVAKGIALFSALCLGILVFPDARLRMNADYRTANLETRTITLEDGSAVTLAPESAIAVDYQAGRRGVTLLAGEAYFDVQRNEQHPFVVHAGNMKIDVLGTAFDVNLSQNKTSVSLERGSIKATVGDGKTVPPQLLIPGERVILDDTLGTIQKQVVDVAEVAAWRQGQLYVVDETIGDVIDMIQPYHPAWISVPDLTLASQRITGFYNLAKPDEALEAIVAPYGGNVRAVAGSLRVISRY